VFWRTFCRSIIGAAEFVTDYPLKEFKVRASASELAELGAIQLIASSVPGYGVALAADVLKESGIVDTVKPDRQIKKLAKLVGISARNDADLLVKINTMCRRAGVSPYQFDKAIWLIYSREFYNHKDIEVLYDISEWEAFLRHRLNRSFK
jgi:hypothetical protein